MYQFKDSFHAWLQHSYTVIFHFLWVKKGWLNKINPSVIFFQTFGFHAEHISILYFLLVGFRGLNVKNFPDVILEPFGYNSGNFIIKIWWWKRSQKNVFFEAQEWAQFDWDQNIAKDKILWGKFLLMWLFGHWSLIRFHRFLEIGFLKWLYILILLPLVPDWRIIHYWLKRHVFWG